MESVQNWERRHDDAHEDAESHPVVFISVVVKAEALAILVSAWFCASFQLLVQVAIKNWRAVYLPNNDVIVRQVLSHR